MEPPGEEPPPKKKRGNPENLARGLTPNQERGPDGKIRRKDAPVSEVKADEPVLSTESDGELAAMRWVTTHAPGDERTWEQRSARQFKESAQAAFYARKAKLEEAEAPVLTIGESSPAWDGVGPCPCCGLEREKPIEDEGTKKILAMLGELEGKGAV